MDTKFLLLKHRWSCLLVFGIGLFSGGMLQKNWLFLMQSKNFEKDEVIRYLIAAPVAGLALFAAWLWMLKSIRPFFTQDAFERILQRDAWTLMALLMLSKAIWAPPLTGTIVWWIVGIWIFLKFLLYPQQCQSLLGTLKDHIVLRVQNLMGKLRTLTLLEYTLLFVGSCLLVYSVSRAATLAFTYDESLTYTMGVHQDRFHRSTNNHFLNTLLMMLSSSLLGDSPLALRLPNVLAHPFYLIFSLLILRQFRNAWVLGGGFLLLNLNPFVLDFFSLARGYGLALGMMMAALYWAGCYFSTYDKKDLSRTFFFAALSVLANLTFLNFYLSLLAVVLVVHGLLLLSEGESIGTKAFWWGWMSKGKGLWKNLIVLGVIISPIISIQLGKGSNKNGFFRGFGGNGFWQDTVDTLVEAYLYGQPYWVNFRWLIYLGLLLIFVGGVLGLLRTRKSFLDSGLSLLKETKATWVLFLCGISTVLQNLLFGIQFLVDRTGILFIPLFCLASLEIWKYWASKPHFLARPVLWGCGILLVLGGSLHGLTFMNASHTYNWKFDADTHHMLSDVRALKKQEALETIELGVSGQLYNPVSFYQKSESLPWLRVKEEDQERFPNSSRFYFLTPDRYGTVKETFTVIKHYPLTGNVLGKPSN